MRAYGTPHALIFPIYGWSLTHIERSFFAALLKERGRGQLTGCFRPFLTCAKRRACGFSAGPSTLMRKIGFLLSFCGGVFWFRAFLQGCGLSTGLKRAAASGIRKSKKYEGTPGAVGLRGCLVCRGRSIRPRPGRQRGSTAPGRKRRWRPPSDRGQ